MKENKLIAEFMDIRLHGPNDNQCIINGAEMNASDIPYDSDWNLLMPVVEKIEKLPRKITIKYMGELRWNEVKTTYDESLFFNVIDKQVNMTTDIKRVYTSTVEFLEWYNKNKK